MLDLRTAITVLILCSVMAPSAVLAQGRNKTPEKWDVTEGVHHDVKGVWEIQPGFRGRLEGNATMTFPNGSALTYGVQGSQDPDGNVVMDDFNRSDGNECKYIGVRTENKISGTATCLNATVPWLVDIILGTDL